MSDILYLQPVISIVTGFLIMLMPRLLNYFIALYLIVTGTFQLLR